MLGDSTDIFHELYENGSLFLESVEKWEDKVELVTD